MILPHTLSELTGPAFGHEAVGELDSDLTRQHSGEPLGERIIVTGRVLDRDGRPVRSTLVEVWQANAAGRYCHDIDRHPAPLDLERPAELFDEPLDGKLTVPQLASLVLRHSAQHGPCARDDAPLLGVGQRVRGLHVEDRFDARLRLLRVLSAGAARTREPELHLGERQNDRTGHTNRLAVHGCNSA